MKFKFHCPKIKFYWHTTTLICLHSNYGCFHTTVPELCSDDGDHMAYRAEVFTLQPFSEEVCQPLT